MSTEARGSWKQEPDDQSERLYSLTLALVQTEVGLTKEEIFSAIRGYRLDLEKAGGLGGDLSALNKKFDRDKEKLRDVGLQIDPAAGSSEGDSDYRYRISRDVYKWPEQVHLSAKQMQLLELAASIWDQASLSPEANNALVRLRAIADVGQATFTPGVAPRISTIHPSFGPLRKAIGDRASVSFVYRKANGEESSRKVQPWQLLHLNGLWILIGHDLQRNEPRNFLLKRIHSKVIRIGENFDAPNSKELSESKNELKSLFRKNSAKIKVRTGTTAAMHFESDVHENGIVELNYLDLPLLAEELMEFGSAVEVIEPLELKKLLSETLRSVITNHA